MKTKKRRILAYYITPHGFGHAVRSLEVIRQLYLMSDSVDVIVVSDLPQFLVDENVGRSLPIRRKRLDLGLVQKDSLRFDLDVSLKVLEELYESRESLINEEIAFLESEQVDEIVCDIPFLPFLAASEYGVPSLGMSNFTWDWIYQAYAQSDSRWSPLVRWIRESYGACGHFLQLPMHGDCSACPHIEDVPLVARKSTRDPEKTRKILGCEPGKKACLISFAHLHLDEKAQRNLERIDNALFFYKKPLSFHFGNSRCLDAFNLSYADVVAAMDAVITKPGYGIVSDCLVQGTPVIFTDRGFFPEYNILVDEMRRHLATFFLPLEDFYAGEWEPAITALDALPRLESKVRSDGAEVCARAILSRL